MANASMIPASVEPCLDTVRKTSPGRPSSYSPTVRKPLQSATRNSNVRPRRLRGSFWRTGRWTTFSTIRSTTPIAAGRRPSATAFFVGRQRLTDLAVVAVDRDRLEPELPGELVNMLDLLDRCVLRRVDGLRDRAADERLHRRQHPDVALVVDRVVAHRAGEHRQVFGRRCGAPMIDFCVVDVGDDVGDLVVVVAEVRSARGHRLLTIDIVPPPTSFFDLTRTRSGSTPGRIASSMNEIVLWLTKPLAM